MMSPHTWSVSMLAWLVFGLGPWRDPPKWVQAVYALGLYFLVGTGVVLLLRGRV